MPDACIKQNLSDGGCVVSVNCYSILQTYRHLLLLYCTTGDHLPLNIAHATIYIAHIPKTICHYTRRRVHSSWQ